MLPKEVNPSVAIRTRNILSARGLTLSEIARRSREMYPDDPRFHVPPNLYHTLQHKGFSPSIQQLFVLSRLSGYRPVDWLAIFGVILDDLPRLQAVLPARYTTLIDSNVYDDHTWVLSFEPISGRFPENSLRPLGEWLRIGRPRRYAASCPSRMSGFLYAKIGSRDALAFPELLPGSIVRIATHPPPDPHGSIAGRLRPLFLVEHGRGLACCRLHVVDKNRVVLCPTYLPFAHVELELNKEARIIGTVDFELRPTAARAPAAVSRNMGRPWKPPVLEQLSADLRLDDLLKRARRRSGLTFREASAKSSLIARVLKNDDFFCAASSLSDYETTAQGPRHIHKMFSLCALYSVSAWEFMRAARVVPTLAGVDAMPDDLLGRLSLRGVETTEAAVSDELITSGQSSDSLAEFPYFLGQAAAEYFKMPQLSIRDIFSFGHQKVSAHPYFANAVAVIINRRAKRITSRPSCPLWAQPSYVLVGHDGQYVCTSCTSDGKMIVMRPFSNGFERPLRLKSPGEIEVIGTVVGILRRLSDGR
jgi:transcriptional regulator with XRE-family HTH domain